MVIELLSSRVLHIMMRIQKLANAMKRNEKRMCLRGVESVRAISKSLLFYVDLDVDTISRKGGSQPRNARVSSFGEWMNIGSVKSFFLRSCQSIQA